jgi:hypothetical protein
MQNITTRKPLDTVSILTGDCTGIHPTFKPVYKRIVGLTPHVHQKEIHAWADGKPIQFLCPTKGYWKCCDNPTWRLDTAYRVSPDERSVTLAPDL